MNITGNTTLAEIAAEATRLCEEANEGKSGKWDHIQNAEEIAPFLDKILGTYFDERKAQNNEINFGEFHTTRDIPYGLVLKIPAIYGKDGFKYHLFTVKRKRGVTKHPHIVSFEDRFLYCAGVEVAECVDPEFTLTALEERVLGFHKKQREARELLATGAKELLRRLDMTAKEALELLGRLKVFENTLRKMDEKGIDAV